ncbi:hypothetical protein [[Acidovorax] ebreus]|uniref:hypothetical protein n=1 Tax=Diaphorobacter sp. LI3 TaxID=2952886 RepID=UPI0020712DDD|nr:hypothetical protein MRB47_04670 [Diaphorobacter sp. LI3]
MNATDPRFPQNPIDPDLAEQARPGYGVPSQDPEPQAQQPLPTEDQERESKSVLMGGGAMAGAAAGAAVGAATAGPVGVFVGTLAGSVAGALGGAAAGRLVDTDPTAPETDTKAGPDGER